LEVGHGRFTIQSLYKHLGSQVSSISTFASIWKAKIPLKVQIFLWLVKQKRVLTRDRLRKRGWTGDVKCVYCSQEETIDHLFVTCVFIQSIWQWIVRFNNFYFDFDNIVALWDIDYCIPLKEPKLTEIIRGAVLWSLWNDRNRIIF
jgi:hypothetical protein